MKPEKAVPDTDAMPGQLVTQSELIGKRVRVIGLKAKPEYNGKLGTVTVWDETRQRAGVLLDSSARLALKPANLVPMDSASSAPAARIAAILAQPVERGEPSAIDDTPPLLIIVESLNPARGHAIEIGASETISALKARYAQVFWSARYAQVLWGRAEAAGPAERLAPNMSEREEYELLIRLVHDGAELPDDARLKECGLTTGSRVIALDLRQRKGVAAQIGRQIGRWWPLLLASLLLLLLVGEASGAVTGAAHPVCNRPLIIFVLLAAPLFVPYGLILSGRFQLETGYRVLWFVHHPPLMRLVGANAMLALAWWIVGTVSAPMAYDSLRWPVMACDGL